MTPEQKQQEFKKEFDELLLKYGASIGIEYLSSYHSTSERIVIEFDFDESLFEENGTGIIPDIILK